jgi:hypothetical protein
VKSIDFGEIFTHVALLEAIRILLIFSAYKGFKLYQIGVKNAFLNGVIQEEVFVRQPPGFENSSILIECTSFLRLCTGLSKHHMHDMLVLKPFC